MTAMAILKAEKVTQLKAAQNNVTIDQSIIDGWDVPDLIGIRGYDAFQLWDFIAHSMDRMIIEVRWLQTRSP